jgi:hypothetical protein
MNSPYEARLLTMKFEKEGVTLGRPLQTNTPPLIGERITILPGLKREVTDIRQEELGEFTLTEIELEPETEGRIPSSLILLTNPFYRTEEAWGIIPKDHKHTPKVPTQKNRAYPTEISL